MHSIKISLTFLSVLLFLACNNSSNTPSSKAKDSTIRDQKSEPLKDVNAAASDLTKYGIANNPGNVLGGLKVGDKAPDFKMLNQDGNQESLEETLSDGPVLLVFLRAEWCSYCVRHLQAFQDNIQAIHDAGKVRVIAVSPQKISYMKAFHEEKQLSFPVLYDEDHSVMKDYKVFFHVTDKYNSYIQEAKGNRIEVFNGDTEPVMPVPATYLIGQDKIIRYVHYDPDYKKRSDMQDVLSQL